MNINSNSWKHTIPSELSQALQDAIENLDSESIITCIADISNWIVVNIPETAESISSIQDRITDPDLIFYENEIDDCLYALYDICDEFGICIGLNEVEASVDDSPKIWKVTGSRSYIGDTDSFENYLTEDEFQEVYANFKSSGYMEEVTSTDTFKRLWSMNPVEGDSRITFEKLEDTEASVQDAEYLKLQLDWIESTNSANNIANELFDEDIWVGFKDTDRYLYCTNKEFNDVKKILDKYNVEIVKQTKVSKIPRS